MKTTACAPLTLALLWLANPVAVQAANLDDYNVVWDTPSADAAGSMPLGNGEIGLNAWVEPSGDLLFYIASTDAWSGSIHAPDYGAFGLIKRPTSREHDGIESREF